VKYALPTATLFFCLSASSGLMAEGDAALGARAFRACAACHSVEANRNMTGPSLAEVWNRKAGSLSSFPRYSDAMKSSGVVWNDETLDAYLKNPTEFMPGNHMTFAGVRRQGAHRHHSISKAGWWEFDRPANRSSANERNVGDAASRS
jgi:cytochrome c